VCELDSSGSGYGSSAICCEYGNTRQGNTSPSELTSDYMASNDWIIVNNKAERLWKQVMVANLKYYPGIFLEGWNKTMKNLRTAKILRTLRKQVRIRFPRWT
jgi:hypothetical protein